MLPEATIPPGIPLKNQSANSAFCQHRIPKTNASPYLFWGKKIPWFLVKIDLARRDELREGVSRHTFIKRT